MTPTSGSIQVGGYDIAAHPGKVKEILGYLPEESRVYETMTAPEYIRFFGECYGLDRATIRERQESLFATLALDPGNGKRLGEFSKGMRRKVALARSLVHNPSVLVYDEATSGLDPMTSRSIIEFLKRLRKEGKTVVMSAHNLYQVEEVCDRGIILRRGSVLADGSMSELREVFGSIHYIVHFSVPDAGALPASLEYTPAGTGYTAYTPDGTALTRATEAVTAAGGRVERIESRYPSLEEMLIRIGR